MATSAQAKMTDNVRRQTTTMLLTMHGSLVAATRSKRHLGYRAIRAECIALLSIETELGRRGIEATRQPIA